MTFRVSGRALWSKKTREDSFYSGGRGWHFGESSPALPCAQGVWDGVGGTRAAYPSSSPTDHRPHPRRGLWGAQVTGLPPH